MNLNFDEKDEPVVNWDENSLPIPSELDPYFITMLDRPPHYNSVPVGVIKHLITLGFDIPRFYLIEEAIKTLNNRYGFFIGNAAYHLQLMDNNVFNVVGIIFLIEFKVAWLTYASYILDGIKYLVPIRGFRRADPYLYVYLEGIK